MNIITCEQVSNGHPDKICDQIADAVVTDVLRHDTNARVAVEALIKGNRLIVAGEVTSSYTPDYHELVGRVFANIGGTDRLGYSPSAIEEEVLVERQSPDIAVGVDVGGAGDQGMMYGYATNETPELLPVPFVVATRFLERLRDERHPALRADAKSQVSFDYDSGRITTFLCSVQHDPHSPVDSFRGAVEKLMVETAASYGLNRDFKVLINPTGRFTIGGPFADCGVTGRKLACDTYGGVGRIAGGALSGKDPTKVDRSGAYMARRIAVDLVSGGFCDKAEVQLAYAIGVPEPVSIHLETFGTEREAYELLEAYVRENYDLRPQAIIELLGLQTVDYNIVSSYGHFGKAGLPWEADR